MNINKNPELPYELLAAALESAANAVVLTDPMGVILWVNPAFAKLTGYEKEEVLGKTPSLLRSGHHEQAFYGQLWQTISSGEPWKGDIINKRKDGSLYIEEQTITPVKNQDGEISYYVAIKQDATQRKLDREKLQLYCQELKESQEHTQQQASFLTKQTEQLRNAHNEALEATKAKSRFLANMSHEIRTPLTSIIGFAEILITKPVSERENKDILKTIMRNSKYLLHIINDVLDISKIESGKMQLEINETKPIEIVQEVQSLMMIKAAKKGIKLSTEYQLPLPKTIRTDQTRLRQIICNLVSNAIKFTKEGSVQLRLSYDRLSEFYQIEVIDTGIGIPSEKQNDIFKEFIQSDTSVTRKYGGTGLGLSISRRLAEQMGGSLTLKSNSGQGSTFTLKIATNMPDDQDLCLCDSELSITCEYSSDDYRELLERKFYGRVLLVDDVPDNQNLLSFLLGRAGAIEVTCVDNGQSAVEAAINDPYDLILMDIYMPIMDGFSATRKLREHGYHKPIVALTARIDKSVIEECMAAGCDDYLAKPFNHTNFQNLLEKHLTVISSQEPLRNKLNNNENDRHQIISNFVNSLPERVKSLTAAAKEHNWKGVASISHQLQTAELFGYPSLTQSARELCEAARNNNLNACKYHLNGLQKISERIYAERETQITTLPPN